MHVQPFEIWHNVKVNYTNTLLTLTYMVTDMKTAKTAKTAKVTGAVVEAATKKRTAKSVKTESAKTRKARTPKVEQVEQTAPVEQVEQTVSTKVLSKAQKTLLDNIAKAVATAPHGEKLTTVHVLSIKHADELDKVSARAFCQATGLPKAYGIEFTRVSQLRDRLEGAGLDVSQL